MVHELWELLIELVIDVLPVFVELLVTDELFVIVELFVIAAELFESTELVMLVVLPDCTVFPLPSEMYAPAANAPAVQ